MDKDLELNYIIFLMKKYLMFIGLVGVFIYFSSCEVDDICIEKVLTPRLIVKFYNGTLPTKVKTVDSLYVWADGKDSLYKNTTVDSILLPLNTASNTTKYLLSVGDNIDTLIINYDKTNVFVSRSCGYKTNFIWLNTSSLTRHWVTGFETINTPQLIENEAKAHVKIYH
jgi:hypothetical protein